jgi:hypothetical protein
MDYNNKFIFSSLKKPIELVYRDKFLFLQGLFIIVKEHLYRFLNFLRHLRKQGTTNYNYGHS